MTTSPSRKDLRDFHGWLKALPWQETRFLYQTYERDDEREAKTKALFERFLKEKSLTPEKK
jgi:hypothetical protein